MRSEGETATGDDRGRVPALEPFDEHNRRLAAHVRPADWVNPRADERYHLVVVGAGTGGLVTAAIAAGLGARVALIERKLMGGDCLNVGCVPSKALLAAAGDAGGAAVGASARRPDGGGDGAGGAEEGDAGARAGAGAAAGAELDAGDRRRADAAANARFTAAMERLRRIRADISAVDSAARYRDMGVDVFLGEAVFTGADSLEVDGQRLTFRRAVIATGTRPSPLEVPGLTAEDYLTNDTIFSLTRLPERLLIVGGGAVGCELAQAFSRFGSRVTIVESGPRLLGNEDPEAAALVERALEADGVTVLREAEVASVAPGEGRRVAGIRHATGEVEVPFDHLLAAVGRTPNTEGLGLEVAGVACKPDGSVRVDDRLRTENSRIYAIGDVVGPLRFTHLSDAHARLVVRNALFHGRGSAGDLAVPWCTYTDPELAHVGLPYGELMERGEEVEALTIPFAEVDRARLGGDDVGFLRVHLERGSDRIVGATIVGREAGEIISLIAHAMARGDGLRTFSETIFPYPTRAEIVRKAADALNRRRLTPRAQRAFDLYFRALG